MRTTGDYRPSKHEIMKNIVLTLMLVFLTFSCKDQIEIDYTISDGSEVGDMVKVKTTLTEEENRTIEYFREFLASDF